MDVQSTFLNGLPNEEVYVAQPKGFVDPLKPKHEYKVHKALYGFKPPWASYECLSKFLTLQRYYCGCADKTLFIKLKGHGFLIVQDYVDDILFCGSPPALVTDFVEKMQSEF